MDKAEALARALNKIDPAYGEWNTEDARQTLEFYGEDAGMILRGLQQAQGDTSGVKGG